MDLVITILGWIALGVISAYLLAIVGKIIFDAATADYKLYKHVRLCRKRLLYTPNKGYVRHGEPDVDEDFTLDIGEESFSSYVMTLTQSWYKLGNVHAGIGFLKEKE